MDYYGNGFNLFLEGELIPADTELTFQEGWSIISYLNNQPSLVEETFSQIENEIIIYLLNLRMNFFSIEIRDR